MRYLSLIFFFYFLTASICEETYKKFDGKTMKGLMIKKSNNIIDTREAAISSQGYLPNSLLIPLSMDYSKWMTTVVRRGSEVIIISDKDNFGSAIQKVKEAGYKIYGYAIYDEIVKHVSFAIQKALYKENTKENVEKLVKEKKNILDLREDEEYQETGIVENSILIPLSTLNRKIKKLPKKGDIYLFCKTGGRALMAMSFLQKARVKSKLYIMRGGINKTIQEGFALVKSTVSKKEK
jgi:rhodanese-related sulfurtransferase